MNQNKLPRRLQGLNRYNWTILISFLIVGYFVPSIGIIALICMIAPVIKAFFTNNREWCATSCPRGIFNDVILKKISRNKEIPKLFHNILFKVGLLILLMYNFISGIMAAQNIAEIGLVFLKMVSFTSAITILLGIVFHPRSWCAFCPMGFMAKIIIILKRAWKVKSLESVYNNN